MLVRVIAVVVVWLAACLPVRASEVLFRKDSIYVFGGVYTSGNMGQAVDPNHRYEDNAVLGVAYRRETAQLGRYFVFGGEVGLAGRFGGRSSAELWVGPTVRTTGIQIGNFVALSPGLTVGLSAVTRSMSLEHNREVQYDGNATLLFYFAPELSFQFNKLPNLEIVYRIHHRSGFSNILGKLQEGSNANVLGLRWRI